MSGIEQEIYLFKAFSMAVMTSGLSGVIFGSKRAITFLSRPTKKLVKFHWISPLIDVSRKRFCSLTQRGIRIILKRQVFAGIEPLMMIGYGHLIQAVLFALSVYWCKEILGRFPHDLKEFKSPKDESSRPVILLYWALTGLAVFFIISFVWMIIRMVREGLML